MLCYFVALCLLVVLVRLSEPVQVIDWKVERLVSEMTYNVLMGTFINPTHSLTHSLPYPSYTRLPKMLDGDSDSKKVRLVHDPIDNHV